jgi:hypothetical protein
LGQASRISGVSPADISILMVWLKRSAGLSAETVLPDEETSDSNPLETGEPG